MKISEIELDAIREMLNIGAGHASTALSELTEQHVKLSFPWAKPFKVEDIPSLIGRPQKMVVTVYLDIEAKKDNKQFQLGGLILIFNLIDAIELSKLLMKKHGITIKEIDEDILKETGNIISGAILKALSEILEFEMVESVPTISTDMLNATMDAMLANLAGKVDDAMIFKTDFKMEQNNVKSFLILLFEPTVYDLLHKKVKDALNV